MTANEIRKKFLDFFASLGHTIVESDSLVPKADPTVLFTTAGMQQFKRQFLGQNVTYKRAASSQKCLRTDDLNKVGKTAYHHTFFEMLGNFSFGDYFKSDAIKWAWEFLTQELKIPESKLWVSVYEDDNEAYDIWLHTIKIPKSRIVKLGDNSNFWPSEAKAKGPNGPCGSCSEIFYDYGVNPNCKNKNCNPDCDCGRFSEAWNLVFTQFNRKDGGVLEPLPGKNIDTGMGLERLVAVVQGKKSNYDTDLFQPIREAIRKEIHKSKITDQDELIIADHIRGIVFGISDGVIPSNDGRGYVIKRLIVDSADIALRWANAGAPSIFKLVTSVINVMKAAYPDISKSENFIKETIKKTEENYIKLMNEKIPQLEETLKKEDKKNYGEEIFHYRDTYGLSEASLRDALIVIGANENEINAAFRDYNKLMEEQKNRSRASSKMTGDVFADADLNLNVSKTEFLGYTDFKSTGKILKIFIENKEVKEAKAGDQVKIVLDKTPFYAESGGQIGDTGTITKDGHAIRVSDTKKVADVFIHFGEVQKGSFSLQETIHTEIDGQRRLSIMRNHTATHLLQSALRKTLGSHVQQQGSLVAEERLRFDFTHPKAVEKNQLSAIESLVNSCILTCDPIEKRVMAIKQAKEQGALAFFAEKYGETVRVVTIDGYSKEFCGGTHLNHTGEIGLFKITTESAVAQGIRRIEAVTGTYAFDFVKQKESQLEEISQILKSPSSELTERIKSQTARLKQMKKELEELHFEKIKNTIDGIIKETKNVGTAKIIRHQFKNLEPELLRKVSDLIKQKVKSAVIALACEHEGNAFVLIAVTDDLVKKEIRANDLIKDIAALINGSGGGRPQFAQAGSKDPSQIDAALKKLEGLVKGKV